MRYLVFDTETTGLDRSSRIVEIAWIVLELRGSYWHVASRYNQLLKPVDFVIPDSPYHSVTHARASATGVLWSHVARALERDLPGATCMAYNIAFDRSFLQLELARADEHTALRAFLACAQMCMIPAVKTHYDIKRGYKLAQIHERLFGEQFTAHVAINDVLACTRVYWRIVHGVDLGLECARAHPWDVCGARASDHAGVCMYNEPGVAWPVAVHLYMVHEDAYVIALDARDTHQLVCTTYVATGVSIADLNHSFRCMYDY